MSAVAEVDALLGRNQDNPKVYGAKSSEGFSDPLIPTELEVMVASLVVKKQKRKTKTYYKREAVTINGRIAALVYAFRNLRVKCKEFKKESAFDQALMESLSESFTECVSEITALAPHIKGTAMGQTSIENLVI
ncbi:hypothetical protein HK104_011507 [Borealophlyctis nickersoniae]|nr:hypothetical protein HK104_011507 [Borealophlyctis nickersoniae]